MATYAELYELTNDRALLDKVMIAVAIACETIRAEDPATTDHDKRVAWAKRAITNVDGVSRNMMWVLLAQNQAFTVAQISGASDATIQAAVDSIVGLVL
jgi:hypothetical protein